MPVTVDNTSPRLPICLIGGTGRSGTTVLRQMFARHRRVATLPTEMRLLTDPDGIIDFYDSMAAGWSPWSFDLKVRRLERFLRALDAPGLVRVISYIQAAVPRHLSGNGRRDSHGAVQGYHDRRTRARAMVGGSPLLRMRPQYWSINLRMACPSYSRLVDTLVDQLVELRFSGRWTGTPLYQSSSILFGGPDVAQALASFCRSLVQCICERRGASHIVEDTPFNLLSFDRINRLLPESRLVHIHREPRDVVASYLGKRWSPSDPVAAARFYVAIMRQWEKIRQSLPDDSYLEITLDDLVGDPEVVARQICAFWDLPWDEAVMEIDLSRSNAGRWKKDIPVDIQPTVEAIVAPYLGRTGGSHSG